MRFSLVIAAHNEGDCLSRTVASCIETCTGLDYEIVVADDASWDGSVEETQARFPRIRVIRHDERKGASPTKDLGASHARGEVLVFLDGHTKPEPGAIQRLVEDVETLGGNAIITPAVAGLCTQRWKTLKHQIGHGYFVELERFDCGWLPLSRLKKSAHRGQTFYESPALIGCALAIHRELYDDLRGFDPHMRSWGVEDLDFGLKSWLMGHPILHDPTAVIAHRFRKSFDNFSVPVEHLLLNQLRMARKNFTHGVWAEWMDRLRVRHTAGLADHPEGLWACAWQLFETTRGSVEAERSYLMSRRTRDEFWYAERFGLRWPKLLSDQSHAVSAARSALMQASASPSPSPSPDPGLELISVQFDDADPGTTSWRINKDGSNTPFPVPEWQKDMEPSPYLYRAGAKMKITRAVWKVSGHVAGTTYEFRGIGPEGILVPETVGQFQPNSNSLIEIKQVTVSQAFAANKVRFFNPFRISWEVSINGEEYEAAGTSENPIYICLTGPGNNSEQRYRTVVHLACSKEGAATPDQALANSWSLFESKDVKGWDLSTNSWTRKLYYYLAGKTFAQNADPLAKDLFNNEFSTGQCECWVNLLQDVLNLNGVTTSRQYAQHKTFTSQESILIKNWTFPDPIPPDFSMETFNPVVIRDLIPIPPDQIYGDIVNTTGLSGQNSPTPSEKLFTFHALLKHTNSQSAITYYDPSYGVKYANSQAFQNGAVAAIATPTGTIGGRPQFDLALPSAGDVVFKNTKP